MGHSLPPKAAASPLGWVAEMIEELEMDNPTSTVSWSVCESEGGSGSSYGGRKETQDWLFRVRPRIPAKRLRPGKQGRGLSLCSTSNSLCGLEGVPPFLEPQFP